MRDNLSTTSRRRNVTWGRRRKKAEVRNTGFMLLENLFRMRFSTTCELYDVVDVVVFRWNTDLRTKNYDVPCVFAEISCARG